MTASITLRSSTTRRSSSTLATPAPAPGSPVPRSSRRDRFRSNPRHRRRWLYRLRGCAAPPRARAAGRWRRQLRALLRPRPQGGATPRARSAAAVPVRAPRPRRLRRGEQAVRDAPARPGDPSRCPARRSLLARKSPRLYRRQSRRFRQPPRGVPPWRRQAPHLRFLELGLRAKPQMPFSVHDNVDHPVSLYAATKKANELMAHSYSYLFGLPATGLRFFTVYGPWGRP